MRRNFLTWTRCFLHHAKIMPSPSGWTDIDFETAAAALWLTQTKLDFEHRMVLEWMPLSYRYFMLFPATFLFAQRSLHKGRYFLRCGSCGVLFHLLWSWSKGTALQAPTKDLVGPPPCRDALPFLALANDLPRLPFGELDCWFSVESWIFSFLGHILWPKLVERSCGKNSNCNILQMPWPKQTLGEEMLQI